MGKFKFKIDENGFYSGYGTDGTVAMTETYNLHNLPIGCRHNGKQWVKDIEKFRQMQVVDIHNKLEYHKNMILELESQLNNL